MARYEFYPEEFLQKCEFEGGRLYEGFQYGLRAKDVHNKNSRFKELVKEYEDLFLEFTAEQDRIENELTELIGYEWE